MSVPVIASAIVALVLAVTVPAGAAPDRDARPAGERSGGEPPGAGTSVSGLAVDVFTYTVIDPTRSTPPRGVHGMLPFRALTTRVYRPKGPGPYPLIVFAHGFDVSPDDYDAMLHAWASAGYVVAAPAFPLSSTMYDGPPDRSDLASEPGDISAVITYTTNTFAIVDDSRVGVAGHSDGGIDAAAIAWNSAARDPRVRSVMILAGEQPMIPGGVNGPYNTAAVLLMGGSADQYNPPAVWDAMYDGALAPKAEVVFDQATHFAPFVSDPAFTPDVWAIQLQFLAVTLRGDPTQRAALANELLYVQGIGLASVQSAGLGPDPWGSFDAAGVDDQSVVTVDGWAIDPDSTDPIDVHLYDNGAFLRSVTASEPRPDIGAAYPTMGEDHGFHVAIDGLGAGDHHLCAYGINVGNGQNSTLGCRSVHVTRAPFGVLETIDHDQFAQLVVTGWTIDPDAPGPVDVHVYVDGEPIAVTPAKWPRLDVEAAVPGFGYAHGFTAHISGLTQGPHAVCVYAVNLGAGVDNTTLGCDTVVIDHNPVGALDAATVGPSGMVLLDGWGYDPDQWDAPATAHIYVDGAPMSQAVLGASRPDVDEALFIGPNHGLHDTVGPLAEGDHQICAYVINVENGFSNRLMAPCRTVHISNDPVGSLDSVWVDAGGAVHVQGWAIDPDTDDPIDVHVYVGGVFQGSYPADTGRLDVATYFPLFGWYHGYDAATGPGVVPDGAPLPWDVCVYAINTGPGSNVTLGCI